MASVEHCLECFEALAAHLEGRPRMTLAEIQKSWKEYVAATGSSGTDDVVAAAASDDSEGSSSGGPSKLDKFKQMPALRRLAGGGSGGGSGSGSPAGSSSSSLSLTASTTATSVASGDEEQQQEQQQHSTPMITESPLFVTWNATTGGQHKMLRGCIGTFEDQELDEGLSSYALTSALQDTRFDPVTLRELPGLEVAVTLLTDFEDCADPHDWDLGRHGLRLSFSYHNRRHGATYLPDVAAEQGWSKDETLVSLMRKAGWTGRRDRWRDLEPRCVRYQGRKKTVGYDVFKRWRDWAVVASEKEGKA